MEHYSIRRYEDHTVERGRYTLEHKSNNSCAKQRPRTMSRRYKFPPFLNKFIVVAALLVVASLVAGHGGEKHGRFKVGRGRLRRGRPDAADLACAVICPFHNTKVQIRPAWKKCMVQRRVL